MASSSKEGGDDQNFDKFYDELRKVWKHGKRQVVVLSFAGDCHILKIEMSIWWKL